MMMPGRERELMAKDIVASNALSGIEMNFDDVLQAVNVAYAEIHADPVNWAKKQEQSDLWKEVSDVPPPLLSG